MVASTELDPVEEKFAYTVLAYTGAFMFAIVFVILVHEVGHFLAYHLRGYEGISIRINPFMGATSYSKEIRKEDLVWILIAGPVFDLSIAVLAAFVQRFFRGIPRLLLNAYAVNAFLLEGIVILSGLFFTEKVTDFSRLEQYGWPRPGIAVLGVVFALTAGILMARLWSFLGIHPESPMKRRFALILPNIIYFAMGPIFLQVIGIDSDFFRRLTLANLAWQTIILFSFAVLAPYLFRRMRSAAQFPLVRRAGYSSMVMGVLAWIFSYSVLN